jgi:hypothetical protein
MLIQIAKAAVDKSLGCRSTNARHLTMRFLTSVAEKNDSRNISNLTFYQSDQSIHFFLLSNSATNKEWSDPSMKFILSNSQYNKQKVKQLDIISKEGLTTSAAEQIEKHYCIENSKQFVGGMGENDEGVWISAISTLDTLDYWDDIKGKSVVNYYCTLLRCFQMGWMDEFFPDCIS